MMNRMLSDLIGSIQSVTLSAGEARRCGIQTSMLEGQAPAGPRVVADAGQAHMVLALRTYFRRDPRLRRDMAALGVPIHVLRARGSAEIGQAPRGILASQPPGGKGTTSIDLGLGPDQAMRTIAPEGI